MKTRILFFVLFLSTTVITTQAQRTSFLKSFSNHQLKTVSQTLDNGYIIAEEDYVTKLNSDGFIEWQNHLNDRNGPYQAIQLPTGNYMTGYTNSVSNVYLTEYNEQGDSINSYIFGTNVKFRKIINSLDSNLIICETENSGLYLRKIDLNGLEIWRKPLNDNYAGFDFHLRFIQTADSSFLIGNGRKLIKTDKNGTVLWFKNFTSVINSLAPTTYGFLLSQRDSALANYDFDGNLIWENPNLVNQYANATSDGDIISVGGTTLSKINMLGNIIWQKNIPPLLHNDSFDPQLHQAQDGGFYFFLRDFELLKTDSNGDYSTITLHIKSPKYHGNIEAFGNANITWKQYNLSSNNIDLLYSTDLGISWNFIVQNFFADSGSYVWQVPEINSENVYIKITDSNNSNVYDRVDPSISILVNQAYDFISANNILMWFGNNGDGSNDPRTGNSGLFWPGGIYATQTAVFEDGLLFGGKINGEIIVNGSTYRHGFVPGIVLENGLPDDPKKTEYKIFKSKRGWQSLPPSVERDRLQYDYENWPADIGAPFTDVDNDGVYTVGIDEPYVGDETFFYVNNSADSVMSNWTYGSPSVPLEFQTTIWGYNQEGLEDVVFKKYKIINKGDTPITDMYLSYWTDDDLGFAGDDYVGVDTLLNLGYTYNGKENDNVYGSPAPAVAHMMVQGPKVPATQNDSAWFNNGWHKGYKNKTLSAFTMYENAGPIYHDPILGEYEGTIEFYNQMKGVSLNGDPIIDPNTGDTTKFMLDGDPVSETGWFEGLGWPGGPSLGDRRFLEVSGPFELSAGDTQEVAYAIIVAKGNETLNSVAKLKEKAFDIRNFYYTGIVTDVKDNIAAIPTKFVLEQNYPNPFNPSTIIKYALASSATVQLKVYDILGRKVATLVNKKQTAGNYEISFDASSSDVGLASGVYIYRLSAVGKNINLMQAKKMVLLR